LQVTTQELQAIIFSLRSVDSKKIRPILRLLETSLKKRVKSVSIEEKYRILIEDSLSAYRSILNRLPTNRLNGQFILDTICIIDKILTK